MIRIQVEKPEIPIEIGDLKFHFLVDDASIEKFKKTGSEAEKELQAISADPEDENMLKMGKEVLRKTYDVLLGEGTFEQLYAKTPSVFILTKYLRQLTMELEKEIMALGAIEQKEKRQRYIRHTNRR